MQTCWRCGIQFEGVGDVCIDCTEQLPTQHWPVLQDYKEDLMNARWELIVPYYQEGKFDNEIALLIGTHKDAVRLTRQYFNQPPNERDDKHLWKDRTAQAEHAASMVGYRKNVRRGRKVSNFEGST